MNFMHGFKSAILAIFPLCQNGTFEPVHVIQKKFGQKTSFEAFIKNIHDLFQGPSNPGFR